MIRSEMVTAVRQLVGDDDGAQFTSAQITTYLNWAQDQITTELGLNIKESTYAAISSLDFGTTLAGRLALPDTFIRELQVRWAGTKLQRMSWRELYVDGSQIVLPATNSGDAPTHYTVSPFGAQLGLVDTGVRQLVFWPYQPLNKSAVIYVQYQARTPYLVNDADSCQLPLFLHELVVLYGVRYIKIAEGNEDAARFISGDIQRRMIFARDMLMEVDALTNPQVGGDGEGIYSYYD